MFDINVISFHNHIIFILELKAHIFSKATEMPLLKMKVMNERMMMMMRTEKMRRNLRRIQTMRTITGKRSWKEMSWMMKYGRWKQMNTSRMQNAPRWVSGRVMERKVLTSQSPPDL